MRDVFAGYHPLVNFLWFAAVLTFTMIFTHPVMLTVALVCAVCYTLFLTGGRAGRAQLLYLLPLMILTAALNPLFNHEGATILRWLPNGNPLTLEAILYGVAAAVMLAAAISWFSCLNRVFTTDKFVWLFGRLIPALSLVLSMTLRFVPRFTARARTVAAAQKCVGRDAGSGNLLQRARHGLRILSILLTWALENGIETADSMRGRGYGLPGRTAFSLYRFDRRDAGALAFILLCTGIVLAGSAAGGIRWQYYPVVTGDLTSPLALCVFAAWLALCALPLILNLWEAWKWKSLRSAI